MKKLRRFINNDIENDLLGHRDNFTSDCHMYKNEFEKKSMPNYLKVKKENFYLSEPGKINKS